jgi:hypothetical protein
MTLFLLTLFIDMIGAIILMFVNLTAGWKLAIVFTIFLFTLGVAGGVDLGSIEV